MRYVIAAGLAAVLVSTPVHAQRLNFEPLPGEGATIRYTQGVATIDVRRARGAVQVTPLGLDHGRLTFDVAVLNLGNAPDNFGVEDIRASVQGQDFPILTRDRLDSMARNRAMWSQIAVAALTGVAAGVAASQRDHYSATTFTPRGTYRTFISAPSTGGQIAAAGFVAGGAYTVANIEGQLDATRAALANEIVQTTTVDPEDSYAGRFVMEKIRGRNMRWPQDVTVTVNFNGEEYPFVFRVSRAR